MIHIAIVYHSLYGHTARQAKAVEEGVAQVESVVPQLLTVKEAQMRWDDLSAADAIIFGAPTYMAGPSAEFKAFQDATSCPPSGLLRQFRSFREGRISGSSQPIWSADETEIRAGESTGRAGREGHPPGNAPAVLG
nr:flavodoxin domain-containing protein [Nitrobacter winogradskyi]